MTPTRSLSSTGRTSMLVGARARRNAARDWFDPAEWRHAGAVAIETSGRGEVLIVAHGDETWVLRHYRRGGLVARFIDDHYLWPGAERTRAFREWRLLRKLRAAGLPVPNPVAAHVYRTGVDLHGRHHHVVLARHAQAIVVHRARARAGRVLAAHRRDDPRGSRPRSRPSRSHGAQRFARRRRQHVSRRLRQRSASSRQARGGGSAWNGSTARCARSRSKPARSSTRPRGGARSRLRRAAPAAERRSRRAASGLVLAAGREFP